MNSELEQLRAELKAAQARVAELEAQHGGVCLWRQNDSHWFSIECGGSWTREDSRDGVPSCCINCGKETHILSPFHDGKEWQNAPTFEEGRAKLPKPAAPVAQAGQVPSVCDGKEQDAFEAWACSQHMDMSCHPLHWLFLNEKTYSARQGWKAALEYVNAQIIAAPAQGE